MAELERNEDGSTNLIAKVTDFGYAKAIDPTEKESLSLGTPLYMAPELTRNDPYSFEVDIWALGVTVHNILIGRAPFEARGKFELF